MSMDWQQKMAVITALDPRNTTLRQRRPNDWYVNQSVDVKAGACLEGRYGNGEDPCAAVLDHWEKLTILAPGEYLVVHAMSKKRRAYRWNGFMWETVVEK